ncbi:MAG: tRNA (adenosine(37)-N6)-dimethylallyltransferase MiaA [Acutalibacteraceae bacterium]|nr:tRNA (adenosine(37)-N6)-dimethylallyltransferase MiaA [Oscillospiraceae bacterium]
MDKIFIIAVVGPTASGKTSLGVELALHYGGEVVSADSMQIYKKMNIATAKPTAEEMRGVPHHLIDFVEPTESYSVARYKSDSVKAVEDISSRGKVPIIVGGTGLYVDSLLENIEFFDIAADDGLRWELFERAEKDGCEKLYSLLKSVDPESAAKIHSNNTKKIVRALEVYIKTGKTISEQVRLSRLGGTPFESVIIGLTAENRQFLYDRINRRVDKMIADGLVGEAKEFYSVYGVKTANQAIGYKELLPYLEGRASLDECVERLKMQTRRYAKRQLTWFRRNENVNWLSIDALSGEELLKKATEIIDSRRTR